MTIHGSLGSQHFVRRSHNHAALTKLFLNYTFYVQFHSNFSELKVENENTIRTIFETATFEIEIE